MPIARHFRTVVALAVVATLAACRTQAPEVAFDERVPARVDGDFPAPPELLLGFDTRRAEAEWRAGDELLYGLRLRRGEELRHWLLRLRVVEPFAVDRDGAALPPADWTLRVNGAPRRFTSRLARVEATVMDERGVELGSSTPLVPRDFLDRGIAFACERTSAQLARLEVRDGTTVHGQIDVEPLAEATVSAIALLQVVQQDEVLSPLLWQVIQKPSLWSVVRHLGARVVVRPRFQAIRDAGSPVAEVAERAWRLPISLFVNDVAALHVDLFVADPRPPYALGSGVLGASARHPADSRLEFSLRLLAARRVDG